MNDHDNGGPAFPLNTGNSGNPGAYDPDGGMSLRDYFAAKAMQAILSHLSQGIRPQDCFRMARDAYTVSDAMLEARTA